MNRLKQIIWMFPMVVLVVVGMACSAQSVVQNIIPTMPVFPTFPPVPPTPAAEGTPTGSSPMSGDWSAQTDFGRLADIDLCDVSLIDIGCNLHMFGVNHLQDAAAGPIFIPFLWIHSTRSFVDLGKNNQPIQRRPDGHFFDIALCVIHGCFCSIALNFQNPQFCCLGFPFQIECIFELL